MNRRHILKFSFLIVCTIAGYSIQAQPAPEQFAASRKPKNVILMIGDGMGLTQIYAGLTANKGWLHLEKFKCIGLSKTNSANRYVTESAAGATAIATGEKTYNGAIGVNAAGKPIPTKLEIAEGQGLTTGLVVTSPLTDATPSAFTAHASKRSLEDDIALGYLTSGVDVFIGGGKEHFNKRKDGRDLIAELRKEDYQVLYDIDQIASVKNGKLAGFLPADQPWSVRGDQLVKSSQTAINILSKNDKGFFLMIEGSGIDIGGHDNDIQYLVDDMMDFDRAIGEMLAFAEKDGETLLIVTADHETGGLTLTGGDLQTGELKAEFSTGGHTGVMVPVFAYGPGSEAFMGIYHNNTIFKKMIQAFGFNN